MSKMLQNTEVLRAFTSEMEKNATVFTKILSKINPFLKAGKEVVKKKPNRFLSTGKELMTIPLVGGAVLGAGSLYGAVTLPPEI